jgi:hypothetical protein
MATITPTFTPIWGVQGGLVGMIVQWALGIADTGMPVNLVEFPDKSIEFSGTWGSATATLAGSNDDVPAASGGVGSGTYTTLNDPTGTALSFTSNAQKQVTEVTAWTGPTTSGGSGTALKATLVARRAYR